MLNANVECEYECECYRNGKGIGNVNVRGAGMRVVSGEWSERQPALLACWYRFHDDGQLVDAVYLHLCI